MTPEIPDGGIWAAVGATGVGGIFFALKMWRAIRQEFSGANLEKQQETAIARGIARTQELENKIEAKDTKLNEQAVAIGLAQGEARALRMQNEELIKNKDYWKERAMRLEGENSKLERDCDVLTTHLAHTQIRLSIAKGEIDQKSLGGAPLAPLSQEATERLDTVLKIAAG